MSTIIKYISNGWYVIKKDITVTGTITVTGEVHLILCDYSSLTVAGVKLSEGNSLNISKIWLPSEVLGLIIREFLMVIVPLNALVMIAALDSPTLLIPTTPSMVKDVESSPVIPSRRTEPVIMILLPGITVPSDLTNLPTERCAL